MSCAGLIADVPKGTPDHTRAGACIVGLGDAGPATPGRIVGNVLCFIRLQ
jgi:hypothetical protein